MKRERLKNFHFGFKQQLFAHSSQHENAMPTQTLDNGFTKLWNQDCNVPTIIEKSLMIQRGNQKNVGKKVTGKKVTDKKSQKIKSQEKCHHHNLCKSHSLIK